MKLLFDENLSPKLPGLLVSLYPASVYVRDCGLKGAPDDEVWAYVRDSGFIIVSKDSDFYQRSMLHGYPPKLVWLRIGNCTHDHLVRLLTNHCNDIGAWEASSIEAMIVIS